MMQESMVLVYPVSGDELWLARHKRGPFAGKLSGFGGGIEASDLGPREAACREVFEESRVRIYLGDLRYVTTVFFYRQEKCYKCFVYILWRWEGEFQETAEMEKAAPYPKKRLPYYGMTDGDREWLPKIVEDICCVPHVYHHEDWTLDRVEYEDVV